MFFWDGINVLESSGWILAFVYEGHILTLQAREVNKNLDVGKWFYVDTCSPKENTEGLTSTELEPVSSTVESTTETRRHKKILLADYLQLSEEDKVGLTFILWLRENQKM